MCLCRDVRERRAHTPASLSKLAVVVFRVCGSDEGKHGEYCQHSAFMEAV